MWWRHLVTLGPGCICEIPFPEFCCGHKNRYTLRRFFNMRQVGLLAPKLREFDYYSHDLWSHIPYVKEDENDWIREDAIQENGRDRNIQFLCISPLDDDDIHRFATVASEMDPEDADKFRKEIDQWPEDPDKHQQIAREFASLISLTSSRIENKNECKLSEEQYQDVERWDLVSPGEYRALVAYEIAKTQQKQHT
eukprot:UN25849